ncbi:transporter substrate-binding domain-containing protein [Vibrio sp. 10N.222.51.C12]|uniref:transporter substrate-binding domain-containing protein n=1 Tax=unclassified Vibrio TaxID=2614977 RepID=UPI000CB026C3|nr:transporter substrate-binding domain-containing protein [Vibrio sp. 10N.286.48.B7]PMH80680.1 hypothetical protein BCU58_23000 [Vibrio sp. 10N.286.48.B7]
MVIKFWNGNKSSPRQQYELELLQLIASTMDDASGRSITIIDDRQDYPKAEDEGRVFDNGTDILVTVKGNKKFDDSAFIEINHSLVKELLGQRILFIRTAERAQFHSPDAIRDKRVGVPKTWADADLFRHNGFNVIEEGDFETIFDLLADNEFDFVCFGANEALDIYRQRIQDQHDISMVEDLMIHYPFPLVFYVNAQQPELAERVGHALKTITHNGKFDDLYNQYFKGIETKLALANRQIISLRNPQI